MEKSDTLETRFIDYVAVIEPEVGTCEYNQKLNRYMCESKINYRYPSKDYKNFEFPTKLEWFVFPSGLDCFERWPSERELQLPHPIRIAISYLEPVFLNADGLYIKSGEIRSTHELSDAFQENCDSQIPPGTSPHVVTSALRLYLFSQEPLIPLSYLETLQLSGTRSTQDIFLTLSAILQTLPADAVRILTFLCHHWARVVKVQKNLGMFYESILYFMMRPTRGHFAYEDALKSVMRVLLSKVEQLLPKDEALNVENESNDSKPEGLVTRAVPEDSTYSCVLNVGDSRSYVIVQKYYTPLKRHEQAGSAFTHHSRIYAAKAVCFLSRIPCSNYLKQCLSSLISLVKQGISKGDVEAVVSFLVHGFPRPIPGVFGVRFRFLENDITCTLPIEGDYPMRSGNVSSLFRFFSIPDVLYLFSALCTEQKILFHSSNLDNLTLMGEALMSLLFPFSWRKVYVPVLPSPLLDYLEAPLPYLIGVHTEVWMDLDRLVLEDVIVVDIDQGLIITNASIHIPLLPKTSGTHLFHKLKTILYPNIVNMDNVERPPYLYTEPTQTLYTTTLADEKQELTIRRAFLDFFMETLSGYTHCLFFMEDKMPVFNKDQFISNYAKQSDLEFFLAFFDSQTFISFMDHFDSKEYQLFHSYFKKGRDSIKEIVANRSYSILEIPPHPFDFPTIDESLLKSDQVFTKSDVSSKLNMDIESLVNVQWGKVDHFLDHVQEVELTEEEEKLNSCVKQTITRIFAGEKIQSGLLIDCIQGFSELYGRNLLVQILRQPQYMGSQAGNLLNSSITGDSLGITLKPANFENLVRIVNAMISECFVNRDFLNAREIIDVASSFYAYTGKYTSIGSSSETEERIYLMKRIRKQELWKAPEFWESTFHTLLDGEQSSPKRERSGSKEKVCDEEFSSGRELAVYRVMRKQIEGIVQVGADMEIARDLIAVVSRREGFSQKQIDHLNRLIGMVTLEYEKRKQDPGVRIYRIKSEEMLAADELITERARRGSIAIPTIELSVQALEGHADIVNDIHFEPRTNTFATAGSDGAVIVWNLLTGEVVQTFKGHAAPVRCLDYSDQTILSGDDSGLVKVFSLIKETKKGLFGFGSNSNSKTLKGHANQVSAVLFGPNETGFTASNDCTIKIWKLDKAKLLTTLVGHTKAVSCICKDILLPHLYSGSRDKNIRVWDYNAEKLKSLLSGHGAAITCMATELETVFSADMKGEVRMWDLRSNKPSFTVPANGENVACFQCRGFNVVTGSSDCSISIWDTRKKSDSPKLRLTDHTGAITSLQWDLTKVLSSSEDHSIKLWDFNTGECVYTGFYHQDSVIKATFLDTRIVSCGEDRNLFLWSQESMSDLY